MEDNIIRGKEEKVMTKAQENLKSDIEKINDEVTIEKIKIFIMGILAQQKLEQPRKLSSIVHKPS